MEHPRTVVAYRHTFGKSTQYTDKEVVCVACHIAGDSAIVLRSENGQRIKTGTLTCALCGHNIKV
jgi:hypothetical protein